MSRLLWTPARLDGLNHVSAMFGCADAPVGPTGWPVGRPLMHTRREIPIQRGEIEGHTSSGNMRADFRSDPRSVFVRGVPFNAVRQGRLERDDKTDRTDHGNEIVGLLRCSCPFIFRWNAVEYYGNCSPRCRMPSDIMPENQ